MKRVEAKKRFLSFALCFLFLPTWNGSTPTISSLSMVEPAALADDFQSLGDQLGGERVQQMAIFCNYVDKLNSVINVLQRAAAANPAPNSVAASMIATSQTIPSMCNLVMAILSAKNLDGVLRASRMANRMFTLGQDTSIDFIEDSVDLAISVDNFGKSKDAPIDKLLNAGMYSKVLNYAFRYTNLQKQSSATKEAAVVGSRQAQLINQMKINHECVEPSKFEKESKARQAAGKKDYTTLPNGLEMKQSELQRLLRQQDKAVKILNGNGADNIRTIAGGLMSMIQVVENRGTQALELNGAIVRRLIDAEKPYPAVGYDASRVPRVLTEKDGEVKFVDNDYCRRHAPTDPQDPTAAKDLEEQRQRKCEPFKKKIDMSKARYSKSRDGKTTACSDSTSKTNKLPVWEAANISVLNDPGFDPQMIADSAEVCSSGSFDGMVIDRLLSGLESAQAEKNEGRIYSDEDAEIAQKEDAKALQDNCVEGVSKSAMSRFNSINGFGPSANEAFEADWKSQVGCPKPSAETLARSRKDRDPVAYQKFSQNFKNVKEWREYYNQALNRYIEIKYKGFEDSTVAESIRGTKVWDNAMLPEDTSYGRQNAWSEARDSYNQPLAKVAALKSEFGLVSLCQLPSYLKRKGFVTADILEGGRPEEILERVQQCRNETEGKVSEYTDIFNTYVTALYDERVALAKARATLFRVDVMLGAYIGVGGVRGQTECGTVQSVERSAVLHNDLLAMSVATALEERQRNIQQDMEKEEQKAELEQALEKIKQLQIARSAEITRQKTAASIKRDASHASKYPRPEPSKAGEEYIPSRVSPQKFQGAKPSF